MTCLFCKGDMVNSTTTFTAELEHGIVIVKMCRALNVTNAVKNRSRLKSQSDLKKSLTDVKMRLPK